MVTSDTQEPWHSGERPHKAFCHKKNWTKTKINPQHLYIEKQNNLVIYIQNFKNNLWLKDESTF